MEAIERMRRALREYEITGLKTTIPFFRAVMDDEEFVEGKLDTGFIYRFFERHPQEVTEDVETKDIALIAAAMSYQKQNRQSSVSSPNRKLNRWVMSARK
jgi:acetyl-CoA carboxylase biotin carboxylase subunit